MYARVSTYTGDPDKLVEGFRGASEGLKQLPGQAGAYFCVDREGRTALTMTLWETDEALEASVEGANQLRSQAISGADAQVESVRHYEVAITIQGAGAAAG
jgi:heme-degrading monooxygenase HmoA